MHLLVSYFALLSSECTQDKHFVFAIRHNCASVPVDPRKLVIPGRPLCKPAVVNDKVAIFKIKFSDCGARSYVSCLLVCSAL